MLYEFALMNWSKGWVQQYHLGALRDANNRMYRKLGAASGFDSIGDFEMARPLA
jgi:glucuronate isomerase